MSELLSLKPAFTLTAPVDSIRELGIISSGGNLYFASLKPHATIKSEPGFEPAFNATIVSGGDWVTADPSGDYMRIDARFILKTDDEQFLNYSINGLLKVDEENQRVLAATPDAKSTGFGASLTVHKFQTGAPKYKELENAIFIGSARYLVHEEGSTAEYRASQISCNSVPAV